MKTLTEMQSNFIINSALNGGDTIEQANAKVAAKTIEINKPKKPTRNWSFNEEDESGIM